MSAKTYTLIIIGASMLFLIIGFLLGWDIKPVKTCPLVGDSVYVAGDTVWFPSDTVAIYKWKYLPAKTDTIWVENTSMAVKSSDIDTTLISNQDTIEVAAIVQFYPSWDVFDWYMEIEHRDYNFQRIDTIKIKEYTMEKVEVTNPWWIVSTGVITLLFIISLIFGG